MLFINKRSSRFYTRTTGLCFLGMFSAFFMMDFLKKPLALNLKTANTRNMFWKWPAPKKKQMPVKENMACAQLNNSGDSGAILQVFHVDTTSIAIHRDTAIKRVLLFGDSQVEMLRNPVYNYCAANNYQLVATIIWYSSTTGAWTTNDTLQKFLNRFKPDFVIVALGLNELFSTSLDSRRENIRGIKKVLEKNEMPYYWIGPAAWTPDKGIIGVMQEELDTLFYPSQLLTLERGPDHRHPSMEAAKTWFDSIAPEITRYTALKLSNRVIEYKKPEHCQCVPLGMTTTK